MKYEIDDEEAKSSNEGNCPQWDVNQAMETARKAARATFNKTRRVNLRMTERDFSLEGLPYQTLLSSGTLPGGLINPSQRRDSLPRMPRWQMESVGLGASVCRGVECRD